MIDQLSKPYRIVVVVCEQKKKNFERYDLKVVVTLNTNVTIVFLGTYGAITCNKSCRNKYTPLEQRRNSVDTT